jgi:hypothetical protein
VGPIEGPLLSIKYKYLFYNIFIKLCGGDKVCHF